MGANRESAEQWGMGAAPRQSPLTRGIILSEYERGLKMCGAKEGWVAAAFFVIPFGKEHKGKTLIDCAQTKSGLAWLRWALGARVAPDFKDALECFLSDSRVKGNF